ncbi:hypothetical protein ACOSQ3_027373 [Xanthoceras sorbifolium]
MKVRMEYESIKLICFNYGRIGHPMDSYREGREEQQEEGNVEEVSVEKESHNSNDRGPWMVASYNKMRRNNVVNSNKNIKKGPVKIPGVGKAANSDFCNTNKTKGSKKSAGASVKGGFNPISNRNVNLGKNSGSKGNLKAKNSMLANSITKNRGGGYAGCEGNTSSK